MPKRVASFPQHRRARGSSLSVGLQRRDMAERRNLLAPELERWKDEMGPVVVLEGVSKRYGSLEVLRELSLEVRLQKSVVVMGQSGSGKSLLLKVVNGLIRPDEGRVRVFGVDMREGSREEIMRARRRMSMLFQNYALFDSLSILDNVTFPLQEASDVPLSTSRKLAHELLELLGLPHAADLFPASLSGGMKKRVSLARALITNPELVLFDEPTTGLDPVMIEFVDELLLRTQRDYGLTSLIISHDMASAFRLADRLAMLHEGAISFEGSAEEVRKTDRAEVRAFVEMATSRLGTDAEEGEAKDAAPSIEASSGSKSTGTREEPSDPEAVLWADLPEPESDLVVEVKDVRKAFGKNQVLHGVNFFVESQRITTLIGGSGSGKTVMMKHVLGLMRADQGEVKVFGKSLGGLDDAGLIRLRSDMGMLFQSAALFDSMSVEENLSFPLRERPGSRLTPGEIRDRVHDVLERLKILDLSKKMPNEVSGGQRKRIGLARAIVTNPRMMIFDEPTTGLDPVMTTYVNDMIVEAQETFKLTALIVSHDMASTFRISHRVAMLYRGKIVAFGDPSDIRKVEHPRVREFIFAGSVSPGA